MDINFKEDYRDKYETKERIGRGIYTEVFKAINKKTKELRAIKIIKLNEIREELKKLKDLIQKKYMKY